MKNAINYYYNLESISIHQTKDSYQIQTEDANYLLVTTERSLEELKDLYYITVYLANHNLFVHEMIYNKNQSFITFLNGKSYVLLKIHVSDNSPVTLNHILMFSNIPIVDNYKTLDRDWYQLWTEKVDYLEYQMSEVGIKYPNVRASFSYYIGLAENAISLLQYASSKELVVAHRRVKKSDRVVDLYNPLNFVLDKRIRDVAEYFKNQFFLDENPFTEIKNYFSFNNLSNDEAILFFSRMIYPSYYFDYYEKIMEGSIADKEILKITIYVESYEDFLRSIYLFLREYYQIPEITWLEKKHLN